MSVLVIVGRTIMYAGRVPCCPLVSHIEYAPRDVLRLEKRGTYGRTLEFNFALA